jgi:hypothetical protein
MKKLVIITLMVVFSLGATTVYAARPGSESATDKTVNSRKTEKKLSDEELTRLKKRVEEIKEMDKSKMTVKAKRDLRKEVKEIRTNVRKDGGGYIYIGGSTLLLIIILLIIF